MTITSLVPAVTMTADPATGTAQERADLVQGLSDLAVFIATHADLPVANFGYVRHIFGYHPQGDMASQCAEVDRGARVLGEQPGLMAGGTSYRAARTFGPSVLYQAIAQPPRPVWNRATGRKEWAA